MKSGIFVGIDPGLDGAVAWFDGSKITTRVTPVLKAAGSKTQYNIDAMRDLLLEIGPIELLMLEQVSAAPVKGQQQGVQSMFRFGMGFGIWLGLFGGLRIPYETVLPQTWKKEVLAGTAKDKTAAITTVQRRYPDANLFASSRSKVPHSGIADAVCLVEFAKFTAGSRLPSLGGWQS
jgi:hypothetical protein